MRKMNISINNLSKSLISMQVPPRCRRSGLRLNSAGRSDSWLCMTRVSCSRSTRWKPKPAPKVRES